MSLDARIHMICGPIGAGKSTYAIALAQSTNGIVFSIDEWMADLFAPDMDAQGGLKAMSPAWFTERVDRCEARIWAMSAQVLARNGTVVWDMGFLRRARRDHARLQAERLGYRPQFHYVTAAADTRQERVRQRNATADSPTLSFQVTPEMFAFAERMFEPPDEAELAVATIRET